MLIDDTKEYDIVWDRVYKELGFSPSCNYRGHSMKTVLPFKLSGKYAVYGIDKMTDEQIDLTHDIITDIFISVTEKGQKIYALDWHHSAFIFDPRNEEEQKSFFKEDKRYSGGGYNAYFPSYIPDGDYYFFIEQDFSFGYLGHPWREEIWVFGEKLIQKTDKAYPLLGWEKIV